VLLTLKTATGIFDEPDEALDKLGHQHGTEQEHVLPTASKIASDLSGDALQAVHGLVGQLKKLSTALRRATANEYNVQAARRRGMDKDGNDMGKGDELWAQTIVSFCFPSVTDEMKHVLSTGVSFHIRQFRD